MLPDKYKNVTSTEKLSHVYASFTNLLHFEDVLDTMDLSMFKLLTKCLWDMYRLPSNDNTKLLWGKIHKENLYIL